jgi:hypothetical protein
MKPVSDQLNIEIQVVSNVLKKVGFIAGPAVISVDQSADALKNGLD